MTWEPPDEYFDKMGVQYPGDPRPCFTPDPTPDEIREACLEIQAGWSSTERRNRRIRWSVPAVRRVA